LCVFCDLGAEVTPPLVSFPAVVGLAVVVLPPPRGRRHGRA